MKFQKAIEEFGQFSKALSRGDYDACDRFYQVWTNRAGCEFWEPPIRDTANQLARDLGYDPDKIFLRGRLDRESAKARHSIIRRLREAYPETHQRFSNASIGRIVGLDGSTVGQILKGV